MKRVWSNANRELSHPIPPPSGSQLSLAFVPGGMPSTTTPYSQGFRLCYRHSRRRLGSPWVGPIKATLKRLKLAKVTPGATSTMFASPAYLFFCRFPDALCSSPTHEAINLQPPPHIVLYQTPRSSSAAAVLQSQWCQIADDLLPRRPFVISPSPRP